MALCCSVDVGIADAGSSRSFLGPSVHHVETALLPKVLEAIQSIKRGHFPKKGKRATPTRLRLTGSRSCKGVDLARRACVRQADLGLRGLPRDGKMGSAYVDTLVHSHDVGRATTLLLHSWGYELAEVAAGAVGLG